MNRRFASLAGHLNHGLLIKTPEQVAERAVCTQLLLTRWALESAAKQSKSTDFRGLDAFKALQNSIKETRIHLAMTEDEGRLMETDYGLWEQVEISGIEPRWESFGVLLFCLRIFKDIAGYYTLFPRQDMYNASAIIPAHPATITTFIESGEGRDQSHFISQSEYKTAVDVAEAWYWRSKAQSVLNLKISIDLEGVDKKTDAIRKMPAGLRHMMKNIEQAVILGTKRAVADKLILGSTDDDFTVFGGKSYRDLDDHAFREVAMICETRLGALGWLCKNNEWDFKKGELEFINPLGSIWSPEDADK